MRLGLSIGSTAVRALLVHRGRIVWAGSATYDDTTDLAETIARLAAEAGRPVRRARVVLERALVQLRAIVPAPPLKGRVVRRYVELEAPRLFRKNGAPLVTDATLVPLDKKAHSLWAGAVAEPVVQAVLQGCAQAGLALEALGPAADVLPRALANGARGEVAFAGGEVVEISASGVVRSRLVRDDGRGTGSGWVPALEQLGDCAPDFAAAYGAAVALPRLALLPPELRAAHARAQRKRLVRLAILAGALWAAALGVYVVRLSLTLHASTRFLDASSAELDTGVTLRRELAQAQAALAIVQTAEAQRSRHIELLANLTAALGDSVYLLALQVAPDGTVRIAGYAPVAARVLATVERLMPGARFEGPLARERVDGLRELDRFAIVFRRGDVP